MDLVEKSINVILENQDKTGALIASPNFKVYGYSWLRDGSFIANALDEWGKMKEGEKFFSWVNDVILRYKNKLKVIEEKLSRGEKLDKKDFLNARFTLEGFEETENGWGNFQLDGYGTWLWGLSEHVKVSKDRSILDKFSESINVSIRYIELLWDYPNYDIWEENSDKIHTSTLACLYGGLKSINEYLNREDVKVLYSKIRSFILTNCIKEDHFVKYVGTDEVDSSLLWLAIPFNVVEVKDKIFENTAKKIERELFHNYGMHRYAKDTYFGGGEWILLSAWMGLYYKATGNYKEAEKVINWIESNATKEGNLPEQICTHVNNEVYLPYWISQWGEVACPLLWSHAMYLLLKKD